MPLIRSGRVLATVHQRPLTQGRLAFQSLYQFLVEGTCPIPKIRVAPHVVMGSNLDLFLDRMSLDAEEQTGFGVEPIWSEVVDASMG